MRFIFPIIALNILCIVPVYAQETEIREYFPPGFTEVQVERGVSFWKKNDDYVHIVAPKRRAEVRLLYDKVISIPSEATSFSRKDVYQWSKEWQKNEPKAFSLLNGQFFDPRNPTMAPLAFSTKMNGKTFIGYGDDNEFIGEKLLLRLGERTSTIEPYNDNPKVLDRLPEKNIIVGLKPDVDKAAAYRRRRTFIGAQRNGNVIIFTTPRGTQRYAARIVEAFGVQPENILMLDGGGSTQLVQGGQLLIPEVKNNVMPYIRPIPQAIGIVSGT